MAECYIPLEQVKKSNVLNVLNLNEFSQANIPPLKDILSPIIKEQGLSMIFAARGIGKTHVALGIGIAIASGGEFLKWKAPPCRLRLRPLLLMGNSHPGMTPPKL